MRQPFGRRRDRGRTSRKQVAPGRSRGKAKGSGRKSRLAEIPYFFPPAQKKGKFRVFILQLCHHPEVEGCKTGALLSAHAHAAVVKAANAKHSPGMCCGSAVAARWTRRGKRRSSGRSARRASCHARAQISLLTKRSWCCCGAASRTLASVRL